MPFNHFLSCAFCEQKGTWPLPPHPSKLAHFLSLAGGVDHGSPAACSGVPTGRGAKPAGLVDDLGPAPFPNWRPTRAPGGCWRQSCQVWPGLVKDAERIRRQDSPRPHKHLSFQSPRSPCGKSGKGPEGFGRFGLRNDAFQDLRCAPHIDPVEDRSCVCWRLLESEQQEKPGWSRPAHPQTTDSWSL